MRIFQPQQVVQREHRAVASHPKNPEPSHECEIVKVLLTLSKLIMSCSEAISHCPAVLVIIAVGGALILAGERTGYRKRR